MLKKITSKIISQAQAIRKSVLSDEFIARARQQRGVPRVGVAQRENVSSIREVISTHFGLHTDSEHPCKNTLSQAIELLRGEPAIIIETGSSAWGANSSMLFDLYVSAFGGSFHSVDLRAEPALTLSKKCSSRSSFWTDDSCKWLSSLSSFVPLTPDLIYLDSWDVDPSSPVDSAVHGLSEFLNIIPYLKKGSLVLVDDTPVSYEVAQKVQGEQWALSWLESSERYSFKPGKGSLIKQYVERSTNFKVIAHEYQMLLIRA